MTTGSQSPGRRLLLLGMLLVTGGLAGALAGTISPAGLQEAFVGSGLLGGVAFARRTARASLGGSIDEPGSPAFIAAAAVVVALTVTGALAARRRPAAAPAKSLAPELRRLAWWAAFLLAVVGTLFASGLYH